MGLPRSELDRRHHWYARLLGICLLVLACFTLPERWRAVSNLGYGLLPLMLVAGLGRPTGLISFHGTGWLFRGLGLTTLISSLVWAFTPLEIRSTGVVVLVLWAVFISWSLLRLLRLLGQEVRVSIRVLMGATAGYLLLGLTAGLLFAALETVQPNSFENLRNTSLSVLSPSDTTAPGAWAAVWSLDFVRLNYFAFITLTSTGFGDIVPQTAQSQMATILVSILGNIYLAVVMGILISRLTVQESAEDGALPSGADSSQDQREQSLLHRLEHLVERLERRDPP
jgi:hypothetical protein